MSQDNQQKDVDLLDLWEKRICPWCGKIIPEGSGVGSGRKSEGLFCKLDCYANYYSSDFQEQARRLQRQAGSELHN